MNKSFCPASPALKFFEKEKRRLPEGGKRRVKPTTIEA